MTKRPYIDNDDGIIVLPYHKFAVNYSIFYGKL